MSLRRAVYAQIVALLVLLVGAGSASAATVEAPSAAPHNTFRRLSSSAQSVLAAASVETAKMAKSRSRVPLQKRRKNNPATRYPIAMAPATRW